MVKDKIKSREERQAEVRPIIEKLTELNLFVKNGEKILYFILYFNVL